MWGIWNLKQICIWLGFPGSLAGKESIHLQCRTPWFNSWVRKILWRRDKLPTPVLLDSLVVQLVKNLPAMQETWVWSLGWEDPLEREWQPTPVFWPEEFHGQRSLLDYSPRDWKESDRLQSMRSQRVRHNWATFTFTFHFYAFDCTKTTLLL